MTDILLQEVKNLIDENKKLREKKGEDFNIFSILNMETNERYTHSAFIAELLDPDGLHYMGNAFLKEFLQIVLPAESDLGKIENFPPTNIAVYTEFNAGQINLAKRTGGYIDILLKLGQNYLSIENKIYAQDQSYQLERYKNFERDRNTVLYLTLNGKPSGEKLMDGSPFKEYYSVSYSFHIKKWIEKCMKISKSKPLLRESLKQYLILIKKITGQMNDELQPNLIKKITENLESAEAVYLNFNAALNKIRHDFRKEVENALKHLVEDAELEIKCGNEIQNSHAGLWITPKDNPECNVFMGLESFNGTGKDNSNGVLMCGIAVHEGNEKTAAKINPNFEKDETVSKFWPLIIHFETPKSQKLRLGEIDQLQKLLIDDDRNQQISIIKKQVEELIPVYKKHLENLKNHL